MSKPLTWETFGILKDLELTPSEIGRKYTRNVEFSMTFIPVKTTKEERYFKIVKIRGGLQSIHAVFVPKNQTKTNAIK